MELTLANNRAAAQRISRQAVYGHFIDGEWVEGNSGETIALENPATREVLAYIQSGDERDVDRAVEAAARAGAAWATTSGFERQAILRAIAQKLRDRHFDYAMLESLNNGKPVAEAMMGDVNWAIREFEYFSGLAFTVRGTTLDFPDSTLLVHREPIGVVAQIIPWNVPLTMAAMKLAPALAAGCTIVLKPAEVACWSVLEFMNDIADLLPPGVINIVTGYGSAVGDPLVRHPKVRKVAFTGSRATAQKVMINAAANIIPQTMELGGKSANIVCEDADIEMAAQSAVATTIFNKGEVCHAGTRVFVHESVEDKFLEVFSRKLSQIRMGDPLDPATQLGAMASKAQFDKVTGYLSLGRSEGAHVVAGGRPGCVEGLPDGYFIEPTIFTDVRNDMRIAQEEIFGPVTAVLRWRDEAEMLKLVNDVEYGLGGGIWTSDLRRAHRVARGMQTGMIWINRYYNFKNGMPTGGYKQSGFGRESCVETLDHYTVTKSVVVNLD
jgi:acyl-CoA reductase-like NAD-dependent aldehyde dehydrogenase